MSINRVVISGNLTRDAELRQTASGMSVMTLGVAVNDRRKNNQTGEWEDYANYIDCTMFGSRAEKLHQYLRKGTKVTIEGKLRWSQWEREGQKRSKVEVIIDDLEFMSSRNNANNGESPYAGASYGQSGGFGQGSAYGNGGAYGQGSAYGNGGAYGQGSAYGQGAGGYIPAAPAAPTAAAPAAAAPAATVPASVQAAAPSAATAAPAPAQAATPSAAPAAPAAPSIDPSSSVYDDDIPF